MQATGQASTQSATPSQVSVTMVWGKVISPSVSTTVTQLYYNDFSKNSSVNLIETFGVITQDTTLIKME